MTTAGRNRDNVGQSGGNIGRAAVAAPGNDGAVAPQREAEVGSGGNGDDVGEADRQGGKRSAPVGDGAIAEKRKTLVSARSDRNDVGQAGGHVGLVGGVSSPRYHSPIGFQD